jgi:hypothetical protein
VRPGDVLRPTAIAARLINMSDPVSRHIYETYADLACADTFPPAADKPARRKQASAVVRTLNRAILGKNLYSERNFSGVTLNAKTRALLKLPELHGAALAGLNRRLIEDAYAGDIKPVGHLPSDSRKGSVLMVLVTMLVCLVVYLPMLKVLKVEEADLVWATLVRRFGKKRA